jgi:hypothetical protein
MNTGFSVEQLSKHSTGHFFFSLSSLIINIISKKN